MQNTTANSDDERFQCEADKYAAYLETPDGRLRADLAFANVHEFLPPSAPVLQVLDVGCGTGNLGLRFARLGSHVTLLDPSHAMLNLAERAAQSAGVIGNVTLQHGDARQIEELFASESFDLVLCHNVLEFVDDPGSVLRSTARMLRGPSGTISVLVRNQPGEVLKAALVNGDLTAAEHTLGAEWGDESLYGGKVRLFTANTLRTMLEDTSFTIAAERGVRVVSDYLPAKISRTDHYEEIVQLERKLGAQPEFAAIARYTHFIARRTGTSMKNHI